MARILDLFLDKKANNACKGYTKPLELFEGLEQESPDAIRCLAARISGSVYKIGKQYRLTDEDIEELICDCITLCLQKIKTGKYLFQGFAPATYVVEIAKNKVRNFSRKAEKNNTRDIESATEPAEEPDYTSQEQTELLEKLLAKLDENCRNLIRLKYLEEYRDKEVIDQKVTQYNTVDSLKNNRARCMKKLVALAQS